MSCFEIAHHEQCKHLCVQIERKDQKYTRSVRKHPIYVHLTNFCQDLQSEGVEKITTIWRGRPRSLEDSANKKLGDDNNPPIQRVCLRTDEYVNVLGNSRSIATLDKQPRQMLPRSLKEATQ